MGVPVQLSPPNHDVNHGYDIHYTWPPSRCPRGMTESIEILTISRAGPDLLTSRFVARNGNPWHDICWGLPRHACEDEGERVRAADQRCK